MVTDRFGKKNMKDYDPKKHCLSCHRDWEITTGQIELSTEVRPTVRRYCSFCECSSWDSIIAPATLDKGGGT